MLFEKIKRYLNYLYAGSWRDYWRRNKANKCYSRKKWEISYKNEPSAKKTYILYGEVCVIDALKGRRLGYSKEKVKDFL